MTKTAVVTGGASGIGRAVCGQMAERGYAVAVLDLDERGAAETVDKLRANGATAVACAVDVSDRGAVDAAMETTRRELGPVAALVTSAGLAPMFVPFAEIEVEQWSRILAINLTGTFNCVQSAIPDMVDRSWGRVVLISSVSAQMGGRGMAHYAASKGGVIALTKTLALELGGSGITVNNISPGPIDTPSMNRKQTAGLMPASDVVGAGLPVGRVGTPNDIANTCGFLCSEEASFITGQTVGVNGGCFVG